MWKPRPRAAAHAPRQRVVWAALSSLVVVLSNAHAGDSGIGVDTQFGNALFPDGLLGGAGVDLRGASWLEPGTDRTPTGFLYPHVLEPSAGAGEEQAAKTGDEWQTQLTFGLGGLGLSGDTGNALWNRYVDWRRGPVGWFEGSAVRPADGAYIDASGSYLSGSDQFYEFQAGRYGAWRASLFARRTPDILSDNTRSIWQGVGTGDLTLKAGLVAGGSTPEQVAAVSAAQPEQRLQIKRTKEGLGFEYTFDREWTGYFDLTNEDRKGARPYGGSFFFAFALPNDGGALETLKPIDDATVNLNLGARHLRGRWRLDVGYSGSFYHDRIEAFDYEMPFPLYPVVPGATSASLTRGQFSPEPDNDYHNLRVAATRSIPQNGQLSITASAARMEQNDALLPPTACQGSFGIMLPGPAQPFLTPCADWNTVNALSQRNADLAIDTTLLDAKAVLQPSGRLTWTGEAKFYREDYRGDYLAYNPLTGQYGYVASNGALGSIVPGETGIFDPVTANSVITRIRNLPLDKKTLEGRIGADLHLSVRQSVGATLSYLRSEPSHRERSEVDDTSLKATWRDRALDWLTLRLNYTYLDRSGDLYDEDPYEFVYSTSLSSFVPPAGGIPAFTVDAMRKYPLASRHEHQLDFMATFIPNDTMTISSSLRGDSNDYAAAIGRQRLDTAGATVQWEWQPTEHTSASVVAAYEHSRLELANVNDAVSSPDASLGGVSYPLSGRWTAANDEGHYTGSARLAQQLRKIRLEASWTHEYSNGILSYSFASPSALAYPAVADSAASAFPAVVYRVDTLRVSATFNIARALSAQVFDDYERGDFDDWHYAGFDTTRVYDHRVYSDGGPHGYRVNVVGVTFRAVFGQAR